MVWLGIYITVIFLAGFALAALFSRLQVRLVELIGSSLILGSGAVAMILLWVSMIGLKPERLSIAIIGLLAIASIIALWKIHRLPNIQKPLIPRMAGWASVIFGLCAILIGVQLLATVVIAMKLPTLEIDGWAIWGLKAKVLANAPLNPTPDYFNDLSLSFSHLDYPLLVPMLWAGGTAAIGNADDNAGKAVLILPVIGIMLLLYASLRDHLPRDRAVLLTTLAAASPVISRWSGVGLADATLSAFILAAVIHFMRWIDNRSTRDAIAVGLFAAMVLQTKLEGTVFAISILIIMTIMSLPQLRRSWRSGIIAILSATIIAGPWLIWSRDLPHVHENYSSHLTPSQLVEGMHRLPAIAKTVINDPNCWGWMPLLLIVLLAAAIGWRAWTKMEVLSAWAILLVQLSAYLAAYLISPWEPDAIVSTTASRLLFHVAPLAALLAGLHWQAVMKVRYFGGRANSEQWIKSNPIPNQA